MTEKSAPTSVWTRPARARREQPTLTRGQIVAAALEILDAEGLEGLSMRRLGTRLNAGATSVYWHVANKDELLELALDHVIAEVHTPDPEQAGWRAAAAAHARNLRTMIIRHPWTLTLFGSRPMLGPNAARHLDDFLAVFEHAGFTGFDIEYAQSAVVDYVIGAAGSEASWHSTQRNVTADEWMTAITPYLDRIAGQHPRLTAHVKQIWAQRDTDVMTGRFDFGLDSLLDGLQSRLPAT